VEETASRALKKSASGVLASLRDSTYRSVRLASSLAAALLNGLFEQPASGDWVTTQVFRLKAEVGLYDLGFKQKRILFGPEARSLKAFSLST